jgi:dipeptidyl aminopeptidase/acylaminoacyl peptidase
MTQIKITEKYERNGWPSLKRPDAKPPQGWDLSQLVSINRIYNHQLSPDGEKIAFIWNRDGLADVYVMPSTGGWPARFSTNRASTPYWWDEVPQWSPDSQWLAFCIDDHVHIAPATGGLPRKITSFAAQASSPVWMTDNQRLIITIKRETFAKLYLTDREGRSLQMLTSGDGDDLDAWPSPDGRKVAFVHCPHDDPNRWDIRLIDLESGEIRTLIGDAKQKDWRPRWSPDGNRIAFLSQRSGFNEAWLIQPDGQGLRQLTHLEMDVAWLNWSPGGSQIACTVNRGGAFELALIDALTGELSYLVSGDGYYSQINWGPEGSFLTAEYEDPFRPPDIYRIDASGGQTKQITFSNLPALAGLPLVIPERVSYPSYDGLEIPALLYRPTQSNGAAILYPHGGPTEQYAFGYDLMAQYFVAKGYTYLAPNYRGSTGYGLEYEHANYNNWGVGDTQDCLYGAKYLRSMPDIDPQRIGIMGGSYGGYMVACCLSRDPEYLFACGVSRYGDANLASSWAQCDPSTRLYTEMQIARPAINQQVYSDGSPIHQAANIQKPVLILHGLEDRVVPPQASEEWVEALRREGKIFEYKTYAGEPHGFQKRATQLDALERTERFLDWYLMPRLD